MEERDQLRHRCHGDAPGRHGTDGAADGEATDNEAPSKRVSYVRHPQSGNDRDGHTDHAVAIARARGFRARKPAQCENEQNTRNEIKKGGDIGVHLASPALFLFFFLVHGEHALGD